MYPGLARWFKSSQKLICLWGQITFSFIKFFCDVYFQRHSKTNQLCKFAFLLLPMLFELILGCCKLLTAGFEPRLFRPLIAIFFKIVLLYRCVCSRNYAEWRSSCFPDRNQHNYTHVRNLFFSFV